MKRALIFGAGPSGLLIAHAALQHGYTPVVVSVKRPSQLFGCQYLHAHIPGLPENDPVQVKYDLLGTPEEYADKVYGPDRTPLQVSPSTLHGVHPAWDIRAAYKYLWNILHEGIVDARVNTYPGEILEIIEHYKPVITVNTIPAPALCVNPKHNFERTQCWAIGDAPELGQQAPRIAAANHVLCVGTKDTGWYRASNVFGYNTIEWPGWRAKPPVSGVVPFEKPLRTDCDCWPEVMRMGRMGKWQKGVLAHHAYEEAVQYFAS